jgi:hypothetical protein
MKAKHLYILILFLAGIFTFTFSEANNICINGTKAELTLKASTTNTQRQHSGDSPFIRFHSGIDENGVSVSCPVQLVSILKPVYPIPEKFVGISEYLSSISCILPVERVFLYSTPLRSPPFFC